MTLALIDKKDGFEIVRDQITAILVAEIASQQSLAIAASKDPDLWKIRIFSEASVTWEQWLNDQSDLSPICNVWFDSAGYPEGQGNVVGRQTSESVFNLDCFGCAVSADDGNGGHTPGDQNAALTAHRALRLVRNILMAAEYTYLGLRGTVGMRWMQSIDVRQPEYDGHNAINVIGARLALRVRHNEFSPQTAEETLEYISATCKRTEDD